MFESDDFDNVLSQLDYSDSLQSNHIKNVHPSMVNSIESSVDEKFAKNIQISKKIKQNHLTKATNEECCYYRGNNNIPNRRIKENEFPESESNLVKQSYKESGRELDEYDKIDLIIDAYDSKNNANSPSLKTNKKRLLGGLFDHQSKRKFPGPAGLLSKTRSHCADNDLSKIEISSQDVSNSQELPNHSLFESSLWTRLQGDLYSWGVDRIDSIKHITQAELTGRLPSRKAHAITAFVQTIDRSVDDPLVVLRDSSGTIKSTLHRDAWSAFSTRIMSEYTALALWKPTVLTTGSAFKKHYLNITLSNIIAIYHSGCDNVPNDKGLPSGYSERIIEDFTAISLDPCNLGSNDITKNVEDRLCDVDQTSNLLEGLDSVSFLDDIL